MALGRGLFPVVERYRFGSERALSNMSTVPKYAFYKWRTSQNVQADENNGKQCRKYNLTLIS